MSVTGYVTKIEFCQMCDICKTKAYKLLKSGAIQYEKCQDGLLHFYKIPLSEVSRYKQETAKKGVLSDEQTARVRLYYKKKLRAYDDIIESKDICIISGYGKEAIRNWINSGKILGAVVRKRFIVAKDDLIDFLVSPYYQNIIRKSAEHISDESKLKAM